MKPTPTLPQLTVELNHYVLMREMLPPATQQEIERRVAGWQRRFAAQATRAPQRAAAPATNVLVMRPGTIPRPIDAFFFEIINRI